MGTAENKETVASMWRCLYTKDFDGVAAPMDRSCAPRHVNQACTDQPIFDSRVERRTTAPRADMS